MVIEHHGTAPASPGRPCLEEFGDLPHKDSVDATPVFWGHVSAACAISPPSETTSVAIPKLAASVPEIGSLSQHSKARGAPANRCASASAATRSCYRQQLPCFTLLLNGRLRFSAGDNEVAGKSELESAAECDGL